MKNLLPIGRFSKVCKITVKALRHYSELGLLRPTMVDPDTGYRYYSLAQAVDAERIVLLRSLEMPLEQIKAVLSERDAGRINQLLEAYCLQIQTKIDKHQKDLAFLHTLANKEAAIMEYQVKIKRTESQPVVSIRTHTSLAEITDNFGECFGELYGYIGQLGVKPMGPPFSIYHDPEFKEDDIDIEVVVPVERKLSGKGRMTGSELAGGLVAYTLHSGPYGGEVGHAYQAIVRWLQERGHECSGPPREVYLVGPESTKDPAEYRTEIAWPIKE